MRKHYQKLLIAFAAVLWAALLTWLRMQGHKRHTRIQAATRNGFGAFAGFKLPGHLGQALPWCVGQVVQMCMHVV